MSERIFKLYKSLINLLDNQLWYGNVLRASPKIKCNIFITNQVQSKISCHF